MVLLNFPGFLGGAEGASEYWRWNWRATGCILAERVVLEVRLVKVLAVVGVLRMRDATADWRVASLLSARAREVEAIASARTEEGQRRDQEQERELCYRI